MRWAADFNPKSDRGLCTTAIRAASRPEWRRVKRGPRFAEGDRAQQPGTLHQISQKQLMIDE
jgi:hypothetical protein